MSVAEAHAVPSSYVAAATTEVKCRILEDGIVWGEVPHP